MLNPAPTILQFTVYVRDKDRGLVDLKKMTAYELDFSRIDIPVLSIDSEESILDADEPLKVSWYGDSFINIPMLDF